MIQIGPYQIQGRAVLAPMAGVTDFPFRQICKQMGAAMVTAEMSASNPVLRNSLKSRLRLPQADDSEPRTVQIVGANPQQMADAAAYQVTAGAQIVDLNMGCPAKKVCRTLAGSALLKDPLLVSEILHAVVGRVSVPVTLKIRTGWDTEHKNAVAIAKIAEDAGIQSLAVHGRTRACKYRGQAEYDTIAEVVAAVKLPVFANGDICSAQQAQQILNYTGASGVMIGRAAQGRPWIFHEINKLLDSQDVSCALFTGKSLKLPSTSTVDRLIIKHVQLIHSYYDGFDSYSYSYNDRDERHDEWPNLVSKARTMGNTDKFRLDVSIKVARKHVCWYFEQIKRAFAEQHQESRNENSNQVVLKKSSALNHAVDTARKQFNQLVNQKAQLDYLIKFFEVTRTAGDIAA